MAKKKPGNEEIAHILDRIADLLEAQDANPFRVRAYRDGANTVRQIDKSVAKMITSGKREELEELPNIGQKLAGVIEEYVDTGRSGLLSRLQGEVAPEEVFTQVPGIGDDLARRITSELDVNSLQELEQAAYDGRLEEVEGFGPKRVENVRISLAGMLSGAAQQRIQTGAGEEEREQNRPGVEKLLDVDAEYRRKAEAGELKRIAPERFNPDDEAWLPILHTERGKWEFTALYSNTARAHELGKTHDWVVLYYERDGNEGQATVVTETEGSMEGKRVVRGREEQTRRYYASQS